MTSSSFSADPAVALSQDDDHQWKYGGPVLFFRSWQADRLELAVLVARPVEATPPVLVVAQTQVAAELLHQCDGIAVLRYIITLPASGGTYQLDDESFAVAGIGEDPLRVAYVSCNGQESGDRLRPLEQRNLMWRRLARQHADDPLHLLLQGGDQLYADEMLDVHPAVRRWADGEETAADGRESATEAADALRRFLLRRYLEQYRQRSPAWLLARVPSLCMWDDHDICDGWGSLSAEQMDSPIGRVVFQAAREYFLLFQMAAAADALPPICPDRSGTTLSWAAPLPGTLLLAPDLRSERRRNQIMGDAGWAVLRQSLRTAHGQQVLLLSSVPVLGPRLSWVEAVLHLIPGAQKYEDDLRDQWQSRAHRDEWRRLLRELLSVHEQGGSPVTVLSGELHLATRCTMAAEGGPLHQLVASGIAHPPPPRWYSRLLGALAVFGESPLPTHPIRTHPLPGQRGLYTPQRNYLMLQRSGGRWQAWWELEDDGPTPPLPL